MVAEDPSLRPVEHNSKYVQVFNTKLNPRHNGHRNVVSDTIEILTNNVDNLMICTSSDIFTTSNIKIIIQNLYTKQATATSNEVFKCIIGLSVDPEAVSHQPFKIRYRIRIEQEHDTTQYTN